MPDTTHQVVIPSADAQRGQAAAKRLGFDFHTLTLGIVPKLIPLVIIILEELAKQPKPPSAS